MEQNNKTTKVYNVIIIDESGSMSVIRKQTIMGINEALQGIRKNQEEHPEQEHIVTIVTFEGFGFEGVKTRRNMIPIGQIADFTADDYVPGSCTPLYDAIGITLMSLSRKVHEDDRVFVTIITDGLENSSNEYSGDSIRMIIKGLRERGWTFAFIGANQDAIETAKGMSISNALNFDATPEGMLEMSVRYSKANRRFADTCNTCRASVVNLFEEDEIKAPK